jgi:uncharacterized protein GlcG (DUF336 family)
MKPTFALEQSDISRGLAAAQAEAVANGWAVSIGIVDAGGHLMGFVRLDGAAPLSAAIALEKARSAAIARRETKFFDESVKGGRIALLSVPGLIALEGGAPIIRDLQCIGAVGVSGVKSPEDAQIAAAGVRAILAAA